MQATTTLLDAAMDTLLRGYEEELNLYALVWDLTARQKEMLRDPMDLLPFKDLLDEKEDLLRIIGQMEAEMTGAKTLVLSQEPERCPHRSRLITLLDRLTEIIEDIRAMERENISLLETTPD